MVDNFLQEVYHWYLKGCNKMYHLDLKHLEIYLSEAFKAFTLGFKDRFLTFHLDCSRISSL